MADLSDSSLLKASYHSPSGSKVFEHVIASPQSEPPADTQAKTKYLSELRTSTKKLQDDINIFLTEKMEKDKKNQDSHALQQKSADELEEEQYGEETGEDDT